jgi:hypothetical protein
MAVQSSVSRLAMFDAGQKLSHLLRVMKAATWNLDGTRVCARALIGCNQPMFVVDSTD